MHDMLKCHRNNWCALLLDTLCLTKIQCRHVTSQISLRIDSGVLDMPENLDGFRDCSFSIRLPCNLQRHSALRVCYVWNFPHQNSCAGFEIPKSFWALFGLHAENGSGVSVFGRDPQTPECGSNGLGAKVSVEIAHCITEIHLIRINFCQVIHYLAGKNVLGIIWKIPMPIPTPIKTKLALSLPPPPKKPQHPP